MRDRISIQPRGDVRRQEGEVMENFHYWAAFLATGLGVAIFAFTGVQLARSFWAQYQRDYLQGAATTLDAMYINMPAQNVLYLGVLCGLLMAGVVGYASGTIFLGVPFFIAGMFLPRFALTYLKNKRDELFIVQLVDALMNMSNSLRAGFSLPQALELIHREMPNPMSQEMRLVCQEMRLGVPVEEALQNLHKRMPSDDMDLVVTAISIVRDVGGNLTEIFDNIATLIRERQRIEGKIRGLTAQGKLQALVMCLLPVVVSGGVYFVAPDMFDLLFKTWQGWIALSGVLLIMTVAVLIIRKIIRIDI